MILYPQYGSIIEPENDSSGKKIDVRKIPGVEEYETNPLGVVYRLRVDRSVPGANEALRYIKNNKVMIIDKHEYGRRTRGNSGINFDSPLKKACLYVVSSTTIATPFVLAGYYTGINTGDWEYASKIIIGGISLGFSLGIGATVVISERYSQEMSGGLSE